jgi:Fe-S oxidoreductase
MYLQDIRQGDARVRAACRRIRRGSAKPALTRQNRTCRLSPGDFSKKITEFSSFVRDRPNAPADNFNNNGERVAYHAACHICRGLGVKDAPRELVASAATYVPCEEEEICCGFGGTYSAKFPEISARLLENKLADINATGASRVVVDCPGCILQIRGGAEKRKLSFKVSHIAELLVERLK